MKHIGIVAVSSEGASLCYRTICSEANKVLGEQKHPEITLHHFSFDLILKAQAKGDREAVAAILLDSIEKVAKSGADFAIIPANSVHFEIDSIKAKSPLPVLSILDIVAEECKQKHYQKVGVLGIGLTMSGGLFDEALMKNGITRTINGTL